MIMNRRLLLSVLLVSACSDAGVNQNGNDLPDGSTMDQAGNSGLVPVLVAVGPKMRTTLSCDGGKTWIANQTADAAFVCGMCDHDAQSAGSLVFANGWFLATHGHGTSGPVRRSRDGKTWEDLGTLGWFNGAMYSGGKFVLVTNTPSYSSDDGVTWNPSNKALFTLSTGTQPVVRAGISTPSGFVMTADAQGGIAAMTMSTDGLNWTQKLNYPTECGVGIAASPTGFATVGTGGKVGQLCGSADGGTTWSQNFVGDAVDTVVWNPVAQKYSAFGTTKVFQSSNGVDWVSAALKQTIEGAPSTNRPVLGPVAVTPDGNYVSIGSAYQTQYAYRSSDGITWDRQPVGAVVQSHPIKLITAGMVPSCPQ